MGVDMQLKRAEGGKLRTSGRKRDKGSLPVREIKVAQLGQASFQNYHARKGRIINLRGTSVYLMTRLRGTEGSARY